MEKTFEREVLERLTIIETKLDNWEKISDKAYSAYNTGEQNKTEIKEIQDKMKWLNRVIGGAIIVEIMGIVFLFIQKGLGV